MKNKGKYKRTNGLRVVFSSVILINFIWIVLLGCVKSDEPADTEKEAVPAWIEAETEIHTETETAEESETAQSKTVEPVELTELTEITEITEEPVTETEIETETEELDIAETESDVGELKELVFKEFVILASQIPQPASSAPALTNPALQISGEEAGNKKMLALTFDDGPSQYTEQILDLLTQNGGTATFFVVGYKIAAYQQTIQNVAAQGSEVAGHSWNHPQFTKVSNERIKQELDLTNIAIFNLTNIYPQICRVPYGAINDNVKNISKELGLSIIQWNIDPRDWNTKNADVVYDNIMSSAKDGGIVVLHDVHESTFEAMKKVIPELVANGYKLVTVSELLREMEPGVVYYGK